MLLLERSVAILSNHWLIEQRQKQQGVVLQKGTSETVLKRPRSNVRATGTVWRPLKDFERYLTYTRRTCVVCAYTQLFKVGIARMVEAEWMLGNAPELHAKIRPFSSFKLNTWSSRHRLFTISRLTSRGIQNGELVQSANKGMAMMPMGRAKILPKYYRSCIVHILDVGQTSTNAPIRANCFRSSSLCNRCIF